MGDVARSGRTADKIRSDCVVEVEITASGGIKIEQKSKVQIMYGKQNIKLVEDIMKALGVENVRVKLDDFGAVPFVLAARVEAAVKRLQPDNDREYLPEMREVCMYPTTKDRFRRSRLYLPGDQPNFMLNAGIHKPDGVILDLEDAVAPPSKHDARHIVRNALRQVDFMGAERMVRINQGEMGLKDLEFIVPHNLHVILLPKAESAEQVKAVDKKAKEILKKKGIDRPVYIMPIIESGLGTIKAYEIAAAADSVCSLAIGLEDYTADIGTQRTNEGTESFFARSMLVNAARAARVQPIDSVFSDVGDMEALRVSCLEAKALGFDGKGCIHPRQIKVIHEAFAPSEVELTKAKRIVLAFDKAQKEEKGVVSLGNKMIDPPVVKRAVHTVNLALSVGMLTEDWKEKEQGVSK